MRIPLVLLLLFVTTITLGIVHIVSLELYLYWQYPQLDVPVHILGGVMIAFAVFSAAELFAWFPERYLALTPVVLFVLIIGLVWEFFQIYADISLLGPGLGWDIVGDLICDVIGGTLGFAIATRLKDIE